MIIAAAEAIRTLGFDPARHMRVTAQDIDIACVQMTYLNCSFYDIPATIIHGNVLTLEERSSVRTPVLHALDGFDQRSEEHTSELQSLMRTSYAVFCLKQ